DECDLLGRKFLLFPRRHFAGPDTLQQQARVRLTRNDGRTAVAAFFRKPLEPQIKIAVQLFPAAVAIETIRLQQRADVFLEGQRRLRSGSADDTAQQTSEHHGDTQPANSTHRGTSSKSVG